MCALNRCDVGNSVLNDYLAAYHDADYYSVVGAGGEAAVDCLLLSAEFMDLL
jgi:hypothetical protein